jgi:hypothetical protein
LPIEAKPLNFAQIEHLNPNQTKKSTPFLIANGKAKKISKVAKKDSK